MKSGLLMLCILSIFWAGCSSDLSDVESVARQPHIDPDYSDLVIPPNMAPLNFIIKENGQAFKVVFTGLTENIEINSKTGLVQIPIKKWKHLLDACKGSSFTIDVFVQEKNKKWRRYQSLTNQVSAVPIDSFVAYRLINPGYVLWWNLGIYQRDLTSFDEKPIFVNRLSKRNCMNCHAFCQNDPTRMMFHMRAELGGTMLLYEGKIQKIDTKTDFTMSAGVYPSWHPGGKHIAYSVNKIYQNFHAHRDKSLYVYDTASDLVIYDIEKNQLTTSPTVSTTRMENLPNWHPNGRDIYFISADEYKDQSHIDVVKYDLMHTSYDVTSNEWGEVTPLLTAAETGRSMTFPKVSPSGRFLMFTMSDYGYFTIHNTTSDLWLYDLEHSSYHELTTINSSHVDSYHSWSSDGHWFVFASKRRDELCSRLYFSYIDEHGQASKPFLLPQKNPQYYETYLLNYNVPELIIGPVQVEHWDISRGVSQEPMTVTFDSTVQIDALSGASKIVLDGAIPYQ